ncbi:MAG: hypothetical protein WA172_17795 [Terriglobales bacterium]
MAKLEKTAQRIAYDRSGQEERLVARGVLAPPLRESRAAGSLPEPPGNVPDEVMQRIWQEEREGR